MRPIIHKRVIRVFQACQLRRVSCMFHVMLLVGQMRREGSECSLQGS
jgi:hypothetical protein